MPVARFAGIRERINRSHGKDRYERYTHGRPDRRINRNRRSNREQPDYARRDLKGIGMEYKVIEQKDGWYAAQIDPFDGVTVQTDGPYDNPDEAWESVYDMQDCETLIY